ncbi:Aminotransferase class-V [Gemmata sp. SH-PL17]|uniref:aminotransferase class V-fold PLP-dependent enzyme n=1 Tax=Gemmata sp. SH-PL17 TaxID=1630693 RepID=UPI00078B1E9A|nr:aminotransferase class V-fold PLP-dependent enzyme [Gemmata sp. SH-PL17]AMV24210.1 Aminotransferase class-V [Gemmata sp. SH-PL17]
MSDLLYLDTARFGRTSPAAQRAERALVSLGAEEGNSAYFERFLRGGLGACPLAIQGRYSGLEHWAGVGELKHSFQTLIGQRADLPVLVAHRTSQLMKLAARAIFGSCLNVLITDLGWPGYHEVLAREAVRTNRSVTTVDVRSDALSGQIGEAELVDRLCAAFARGRCDGLFLSAVSNWGVRIPIERIVRRLEAAHRVWFVVVDGTQEFCHVPGRLETEYCDLYLTGCHKWLGAHYPMGLGFYGRSRSRSAVDTAGTRMAATGDLDDPLLRFVAQLETGEFGAIETLNLTPLFTTRAAISDAQPQSMMFRAENMRVVTELAPPTGWKPLLPDQPLRSGILLLEPERAAVRSVSPDTLRTALRDAGVAATTYGGGLVRLSMPATEFTSAEREHLSRALHTVA